MRKTCEYLPYSTNALVSGEEYEDDWEQPEYDYPAEGGAGSA